MHYLRFSLHLDLGRWTIMVHYLFDDGVTRTLDDGSEIDADWNLAVVCLCFYHSITAPCRCLFCRADDRYICNKAKRLHKVPASRYL